LLDRRAQLVVCHTRDDGGELGRQRLRRRHLAEGAALGRALFALERADLEAQGLDDVPVLGEARHELRREHGQLVRPDARRDLHDEHAALDGDRPRAIRDPRADRGAPGTNGDRRTALREAIFARSTEHLLERLGGVEIRAALPFRHAPRMLASGEKPPTPQER
jgi:hypothetical protein